MQADIYSTEKNSLSTHIKKIRDAKITAKKIASVFSDSIPKASLAKAWECVFDILCNGQDDLSISELNTIAGIIQKLSAVKNSDSQEISKNTHNEISEASIKKIEEKLKLL